MGWADGLNRGWAGRVVWTMQGRDRESAHGMMNVKDRTKAAGPAEHRWLGRRWPVATAAGLVGLLIVGAVGYDPPSLPALPDLIEKPEEVFGSILTAGVVFGAWLVLSGALGWGTVAAIRPRDRPATSPADLAVAAGVGTVVVSQLALLGWGANGLLAGPTVAFLLGAAIAASWQRGLVGRWLAAGLVAVILAAPPLIAIGLFRQATHDRPPLSPVNLDADDKRALVEKVRQAAEAVGPDAPASLHLTPRDTAVIVGWLVELADVPGGVAEVAARTDGGLDIAAAASFADDQWVSLRAVAHVSVDGPRIRLNLNRIRVGEITLPSFLNVRVNIWLNKILSSDEDFQAVAKAVERLAIDRQGIDVAYWPDRMPERLVGRLAGEGGAPAVQWLARRYARVLEARASRFSSRDTRDVMRPLVHEAFDFAAKRSARGGDPVLENRAAIYTLAIVIGHRGVQRLYGDAFESSDELARARWRPRRIHLHGRYDLARHFWLSAAVALAADSRVADLLGQWKEQIDSGRGGSGFSFADLLADRAGARFAEFALDGPNNARLIQRRLRNARSTGVLMPDPAGLPEGLTDAQFQARFGGPKSPEYARLVDELDRRIDALPLYQRQASGSNERATRGIDMR